MIDSRNKCDIAIVGSGITGLSTYYHLKALGYNTKIIATEPKKTTTGNSSHWVSAGQNDLVTRLYHAHGSEIGGLVWGFADKSFDYFKKFCLEKGVSLSCGHRVYLASSEMELKELGQVKDILQHYPYPVVEKDLSQSTGIARLQASGFFDDQAFFEILEPDDIQIDTVKSIRQVEGGVMLEGHKSHYACELVIICAHTKINHFQVMASETLVPYADQWSEVRLRKPLDALPMGSLISWNFGYFWLSVREPKLVRIGGARFLRPYAGIGAEKAELSKAVTQCYLKEAEKILGIQVDELVTESAALGCRACDEIPVLGPSSSHHRILLATGFMGQGICQGFYAGYCLAKLIENGNSALIPRILWPERLRQL